VGVHLHHHLERLAGVAKHDQSGVARHRGLAMLAGTSRLVHFHRSFYALGSPVGYLAYDASLSTERSCGERGTLLAQDRCRTLSLDRAPALGGALEFVRAPREVQTAAGHADPRRRSTDADG
jgi:hypothetical protein